MIQSAQSPIAFGVLVPLDGSPLAEQALPVAASIAHRTRATVHLLGVLPSPLPPVISVELAASAAAVDRLAGERLRNYLAGVAGRIAARHDVQVKWEIRHGAPAEEIAAHVTEHHPGLVVMTTHGRGGISRLWLGSVADAFLRRSTVPVLLFRPGHKPPSANFSRIMVALDGSKRAEAILEPVVALAHLTPDASVTLVQVLEPPLPLELPAAAAPCIPADWPGTHQAAATRYLDRIAGRLRERGLQVSTSVVIGAGVAHQLTELARALDASLIALATHGSAGLERLMLGSVADKVVRGADQAVLVAPGHTVRAPATPRRRHRRAQQAR